MRFKYLPLLVLLLSATATASYAQLQRFIGPTAGVWTFFGESVAMHGRYAIIGEPAKDAQTTLKEKVHIYYLDYDGWKLKQTFQSANAITETNMGARTGMSENWLAFTQINTASSWKVLLYQKQADTFAYRQTIVFADPWDGQFVCKNVSITDQHLIVGGSGSALCYKPNATTGLWELIQTIAVPGTEFGHASAIWENRAVICNNTGDYARAYEFVDTMWVLRATLTPGTPGNHHFGSNCAIYKDLIAVTDFGGMYNTAQDTSKAFLYKWGPNNNISKIATLKSPNNHNFSNFGGAYIITDDYLFVGANTDFQKGKVFKFRRNGDQFQYLRAYRDTDNPDTQPTFGECLAQFGNQWIVGDPHYAILRGAVYWGQVTDTLYAAFDCQLPLQVNGNTVDQENFFDLFHSDALSVLQGKPKQFGMFEVSNLFKEMGEVLVCQNTDTVPKIKLNFLQGYNLRIPEGSYARWETSFVYQGQTYTASDILDDTTALAPTIVNAFPVGEVAMNLHFGKTGEPPCKSFPLTLWMSRKMCPMDTTFLSLIAGDTISLNSNCMSYSNLADIRYYWSVEPLSQKNALSASMYPGTKAFPLLDATYALEISDINDGCAATQYFHIDVTVVDADQDGVPSYLDCNDQNPNINPGASEIPLNGIDEDCVNGDDGYCFIRRPGHPWGMDAMVQSDKSTTNGAGLIELNVAYSNLLSTEQRHYSLLKFDLSGLPADAVVDSAFLSLYFNPNDQLGIFGHGHYEFVAGSQLALDRLTAPFNPNNTNWNTQPAFSAQNRVTVNKISYPGATSNFTHMQVTKLVRDMLDPNKEGNHGFRMILIPLTSTRQLIFASSNHPDPNRHPKLELCWHSGTTSPVREVRTVKPILLSPNPVHDILNISIPEQHVRQCQLLNAQGQILQTIPLHQAENRVNMEGLPAGVYMLHFDDGSVRSIVKL
jgi:Secretion system C-terminal sorting domain/Putative metal-binding motif